ncbi:MAG: hypothetical protein WCX90_07710 [Thiohalomonadaceae bacterium]|jgi:methylmalonyl-CoA mutase cobalamin-binding subunit
MSKKKTVLVLVPGAAEQARGDELLTALQQQGAAVQQLRIDGNYEAVLDALAGDVTPVVVK